MSYLGGKKIVKNYIDSYLTKVLSWERGQNPWVTVETESKNRPFERVRANILWGDPRVGWFYSGKNKDKDKS